MSCPVLVGMSEYKIVDELYGAETVMRYSSLGDANAAAEEANANQDPSAFVNKYQCQLVAVDASAVWAWDTQEKKWKWQVP